MADVANDIVDVVAEVDAKKKEVVDSPTKEDKKVVEDKKDDKENGDSCEAENGKEESDEVEEKEPEIICPIKRKSTSGKDISDLTPAEGVSPEKKAKLDDVSAEAESNEAEIVA